MSSETVNTLYLVDTPIGNLSDLSDRAKRVFRNVSLVIAEDTRRTNKLLLHLDTKAELVSFYEHSGDRSCEEVVEEIMKKGEAALVSDAGSPVVSDPAWRLVRAVHSHGDRMEVVPVPGPSAVTTAIAVSGFRADQFRFVGYPPEDHKERDRWLRSIQSDYETVVLFVPPHDLRDLASDLADQMGDRPVAMAKELTKEHETVVHGTCSELPERIREMNTKGEWTVVLGPVDRDESDDEPISISDEKLDLLLETDVKPSSAARILAEMRDVTRGEAYDLIERRKQERDSSSK